MLRSRPGEGSPAIEEVRVGLLHIIWMIIVGFIVGVLARWFYPGAVTMGFWATAAVGIIGSLVGGVIGGLLWRSPDGKFHPAGFILSIIGALIVLWL
ncbi:MAG TPA: GlsB/YeaQ/YmgE family stress response membrane protein, partial [Casimicrobiaceae bacterium]|nr:GlsB/YeaQ/YmgE family stress response membrane protein [Casimicrobiaceae bacterium]